MILKLAWRNIWRNKKRSLITIASILFAVFFAVLTRSFQFGTYGKMIEDVVGLYTGYVQIHQQGYWEDPTLDRTMERDSDLIERLRRDERITRASPRLESFALLSYGESSRGAAVIGLLPELEAAGLLNPANLAEGKMINSGSRGLVVGAGIAELLKAGVGDTLVLLGQGYHGASAAGKYVIEGTIKLSSPVLNDGFVFMPLAAAQEFFAAPSRLTALALMIDDGDKALSDVLESLEDLQAKGNEVMDWKEMMPELIQSIQADSAGGLIMLYVLYLIVSFGIFGTLLMMVEERKREFGILLSLGMARARLQWTVAVEVFVMTGIGVVSGIAAIWPVIFYFNRNPFEFTGQAAEAFKEYGMEAVIPTTLDPSIPVVHGITIFIIAMLLAAYPLWILRKLKPVEAVKA